MCFVFGMKCNLMSITQVEKVFSVSMEEWSLNFVIIIKDFS